MLSPKRVHCFFNPLHEMHFYPHQSSASVWWMAKQQGMKNERHVLLFSSSVPFFPTIFSSITLSLVFHSSPRGVRPKSGQQMRNKWVLSGTHEGGRYAYQGFSGGLYPACHSCDFSSPPSSSCSLPAILSEECGNATRPRMEGQRKWDKGERMESLGADRPTLHADTFSWAQAD